MKFYLSDDIIMLMSIWNRKTSVWQLVCCCCQCSIQRLLYIRRYSTILQFTYIAHSQTESPPQKHFLKWKRGLKQLFITGMFIFHVISVTRQTVIRISWCSMVFIGNVECSRCMPPVKLIVLSSNKHSLFVILCKSM